ncbi:MAG: hypothetical protein AVDCRST_MAG10-3005, partial [uncultured Acidimicrobiales bacterium]
SSRSSRSGSPVRYRWRSLIGPPPSAAAPTSGALCSLIRSP